MENERIKALLQKANSLPEKPGVYKMYDEKGTIIYVGKAVNLKNRVTSYFRGTHYGKTAVMVSEIRNLEVIVTDSELNALLTECSLIKHHDPMYNIKLKDGKGYPFIRVWEEKGFPRIARENSKGKKSGRFFGPFTQKTNAALLISLIQKAFQLPTCSAKSIPDKLCLEYHIKNCRGFCRQKVSAEETDAILKEICAILEGKTDDIYQKTEQEMLRAADKLNFEYAAQMRDRLHSLSIIQTKQKPLIQQNRNADYIACKENDQKEAPKTCFFMLRIRNGYVVGERCDTFQETLTDELFCSYLSRFYSAEEPPEGKIYVAALRPGIEPINQWLKEKITLPRFEQDKKLLQIAQNNAEERLLLLEGKTKKQQRLLAAFSSFTGIHQTETIEIYDTSSIAGSHIVCGMVVCKNGELQKSRYRRFKIEKTLGNDDTAYMKEAVSRRLKRFLAGDEKFSPLPDLILCDGGLGQVHAVMAAVQEAGLVIRVAGLKKDSRHRTKSFVYEDGRELLLAKNHEAHTFCGRLQEEVHRYSIDYHRKLRDSFSQQSELLQIPGVGKTKARDLFMKFKSLDKIKNASNEELTAVKGVNEELAEKIRTYLNQF